MFSDNDYELYRHAWRYALAPHQERQLSDSQCKTLLKKGGLMVRNTFDFDYDTPTDFWYVIKDSFGGFEELSSNVRRKIRHAFDTFDYKLIDNQIVTDLGYPIIKATFEDYRIKDREMNESVFADYLSYCKDNSFDYWGIYDKENQRLIGFCTVHLWDDSCEYGMFAVLPEYKRNATYPYYGLFHRMNEYYLVEKHYKYVSDSARSITEHSNIHPFLEQNFKFRKAYCKLKMKYKWWFGTIVRVLYPFRRLIWNKNVIAVLKMHAMQS